MGLSKTRKFKRYYLKLQVEFFKRATEYMLLMAVMFAVFLKFYPHFIDRFPAGNQNGYEKYYDYVEPSNKEDSW